jgi:hypothetical protein
MQLALTLLVPAICANYVHGSTAPDYAALFADWFYRCSNFHSFRLYVACLTAEKRLKVAINEKRQPS